MPEPRYFPNLVDPLNRLVGIAALLSPEKREEFSTALGDILAELGRLATEVERETRGWPNIDYLARAREIEAENSRLNAEVMRERARRA